MSGEYRVIDTSKFDAVMDMRYDLIRRYNDINTRYHDIVNTLSSDWEGKGADAFNNDAVRVKENLGGVCEMLTMMCNMLLDCRTIVQESDSCMGNTIRESTAEPGGSG